MERTGGPVDKVGDIAEPRLGSDDNNNNKKRSSHSRPRPPPADKIRLLLHAVDGCVPFLNPSQLERHFPPPPPPSTLSSTASSSQNNVIDDDDNDVLWIGLSVRDTCVVPVFDDGTDTEQQHDSNTSNTNDDGTKKKNQKNKKQQKASSKATKEDDKKKKARGYTFACNIQPDPWLLPYTRVTVPLFLEEEDDDFVKNKKKAITTTTTNTTKNNNNNNDQYCQVWTPHGRQKLTPESYTKSSKSLHSHFTVPLYDWIPPTSSSSSSSMYNTSVDDNNKLEDNVEDNNNNKMKMMRKKKKNDKQKQKIEKTIERTISRNQQWFSHIHDEWADSSVSCSTTKEKKDDDEEEEEEEDVKRATTLWSPILLPPLGNQNSNNNNNNADDDDDDDRNKKLNFLLQQDASLPSYDSCTKDPNNKDRNEIGSVVSGVAFIGSWTSGIIPCYFDSSCCSSSSTSSSNLLPRWRAVLTTSSLSQIIGIASEGYINVIGTSLPTHWAKEKKALGFNLSPLLVEIFNNKDNAKISTTTTTSTSSKRMKLGDNIGNGYNVNLDCDGCMDMSDKMYQRDTSPLVVGCQCMVCSRTRFSRAYIHHLVCAKELLAEILIFAHNLHHLLELIRTFNMTEDDLEKREELSSFLRKQFEN